MPRTKKVPLEEVPVSAGGNDLPPVGAIESFPDNLRLRLEDNGQAIYGIGEDDSVWNPQNLSDEQVRLIADGQGFSITGYAELLVNVESNKQGMPTRMLITWRGADSATVALSRAFIADADPRWFGWINALEYKAGDYQLRYIGLLDRNTLLFNRG